VIAVTTAACALMLLSPLGAMARDSGDTPETNAPVGAEGPRTSGPANDGEGSDSQTMQPATTTPPSTPPERAELVQRQGLNAEKPLTRAETARPLFEHSNRPASSEYGPMGALDSRQMLFEPGEPTPRADGDEATAESGQILVFGANGPQQIQGMTRADRTSAIYNRLRRVMELGRTPR